MPMSLSIVTAQRLILERDDVTKLVVPAADGQITILPKHAALLSALGIGEMLVHTSDRVEPIVIHGGFVQVLDDQVSVLADAAEHVDDIDVERAEAARERAQRRLAGQDTEVPRSGVDVLRAQLALSRAIARINVVRRRRTGVPSARG
ncbi:MAG: ATP synthase F1 subunit epsilon [Chloroflexi bacterium]|nr:ATP synthase F1 subunit epsilon [Chloroflexota bacterium]MQC17048.1 ATP synthase F1 subunit epsilon [Chloroflexota bacterium]